MSVRPFDLLVKRLVNVEKQVNDHELHITHVDLEDKDNIWSSKLGHASLSYYNS